MPLAAEYWPNGRSRAVVFNTEAAYFFLTSPEYRADAIGANDVYCDGVGLAAYVKLRFRKSAIRRHGPDVMRDYLRTAKGRRVCLLGGSPAAHEGLRFQHPDFFSANQVVSDTRHFRETEYQGIAAEIAGGGFDDVLIFLGLRRQERFQALLHAAGFDGSSIGLGAAIDFLSGTKRRAGIVWQRLGLEWLPRLVREPRMWPRMLRSLGLFAQLGNPTNTAMRNYLLGHRDAPLHEGRK